MGTCLCVSLRQRVEGCVWLAVVIAIRNLHSFLSEGQKTKSEQVRSL